LLKYLTMVKEKFMGEPQLDKLEPERLPRKPRVLIVEDDKAVDELLRLSLKEDGESEIEEGFYESAQQVIAMLEQRKPGDPRIDLLITDLGLKDGENTGTRVVEVFKNKYPGSSVVVLTGSLRINELYTPEQKENLNLEVWPKPIFLVQLRGKVGKVKDSINKPSQAPNPQ